MASGAVSERNIMEVTIYTDGSARGNPDGPGGYGVVIIYVDPRGGTHVKEISEGFEKTTNNRMELMGVIAGLEALNRPCKIDLYSDSQYVIKAFNDHWIDNWIKKGWKKSDGSSALNIDLWQKILSLVDTHSVEFVWVKGHAGHKYNERCDTLAVSSAEKAQTLQRDV
jgi:ribonuclease HI